MLIDRNNLHDVDTWMFFKWVFKTFLFPSSTMMTTGGVLWQMAG